MNTTATTSTTARALRPLLLPCPRCGEAEASISIDLGSLDCEAFRCRECEADFTIDDVRAFIARWSPVVAWLELVPQPAEAE